MKAIRVVAPFRPFEPESDLHKRTADFDWIDAIRMLQASVERSCPTASFHVITDVDTDLPVPMLRYQTTQRRLMLWTLEACLRYLESDDFDRDTVMLDCDQLVYADLAQLVTPPADLMVCVRTVEKVSANQDALPLLNGVQVWSRRGKDRLVAFYRMALAVAEGLPEERIVWGADTDALCELLAPIAVGLKKRSGLTVHMRESSTVIEAFSSVMRRWLAEGSPFVPSRPVLDFRHTRKPSMRPVFEHTFSEVTP